VDILIPNEGELKLLGGEESLSKMVKTLVITLGEKGFKIIENNETNEYPCIKITPIDTTAAGDTFVGSMLAAYSIDKDLQKSAIYGSLAASIACTKKGAQPSIPTRNEVESY
jgi:ribokinase